MRPGIIIRRDESVEGPAADIVYVRAHREGATDIDAERRRELIRVSAHRPDVGQADRLIGHLAEREAIETVPEVVDLRRRKCPGPAELHDTGCVGESPMERKSRACCKWLKSVEVRSDPEAGAYATR